jgi:hypothetical protein
MPSRTAPSPLSTLAEELSAPRDAVRAALKPAFDSASSPDDAALVSALATRLPVDEAAARAALGRARAAHRRALAAAA